MDNEIDLSKLSIEKLQAMKKENLENKWNYYHLMKNCDKMDKFYTYFIYKKCNHEWKRSNIYCGPYDSPPKICIKCDLEMDNYIRLPN